MIKSTETLPDGDSATNQWPDYAQGAMERLAQRSEAEKARDLADLRDFGERCQRLEHMRAELTEQYPDQWVALTETYEQVVADTITELVIKIERNGGRPGYAARKFMNAEPRHHIL